MYGRGGEGTESTGAAPSLLNLGADDGNGLEHSDPTGRAFLARGDQSEGTLFAVEGDTVHGVGHDYFGFDDARIELCQRENHSIAVLPFGYDVGGHRRTSKLVALRNSGPVKNFFQKHTLICFFLLVVRIHDGESFSRHLFEIGDG